MKLLIKALCCGIIISCLLSLIGFSGACEDIQSKVFRLHIIANSDSEEDQELKLKVRDALTKYTDQLFSDCHSKEEAIAAAEKNLQKIQNYAQKIVRQNNSHDTVQATILKMPFDTRVYEEFSLPAGYYDALRITIGTGKGHNWWCVLYPAVCVPSAEKKINSVLNTKESDIVSHCEGYQIKFKITEIFESVISFFHR